MEQSNSLLLSDPGGWGAEMSLCQGESQLFEQGVLIEQPRGANGGSRGWLSRRRMDYLPTASKMVAAAADPCSWLLAVLGE